MNLQTTFTDQHTALLSVEIDADRLATAKQKAARKLSNRVNIPGFRKGKAPYNILVRMIGEPAILEEAVEVISNDIYKDILVESGVQPYGPGAIEDVKFEDPLKIIFSVPLVPVVELNAYRDVRLDYALPTVDDEAVNRAMTSLQEQNAVVEPSNQPAVLGDRLTFDLNAVYADGAEDEEGDEDEDHDDDGHEDHDHEDHDHDDHEGHEHDHDGPDLHELSEDMDGEPFMHEHGFVYTLDDSSELLPGFNAQLLGTTPSAVHTFELTIPEDSEEYVDEAGRPVKFLVVVRSVEKQTLPTLNDDFAARVTAEEEKPLTLLELRMRVRENLEQSAKSRYETDYGRKALDAMVEQAVVKYPPVMLDEEVERYLNNLDQNLRQNGLTLDSYMTIYRKTKEELAVQYREPAAQSLKRSLVMGEIMAAERMMLQPEDMEAEIERVSGQFGEERRDQVRQLFSQQGMYESLATDLLNNRVRERIALIARGEAPAVPESVDETTDAISPAADESATAPSADADADTATADVSQEDKGESS